MARKAPRSAGRAESSARRDRLHRRRRQRARPARRADPGDAARVRRTLGRRLLCRRTPGSARVEFLFERLAVRWEIAGTVPDRGPADLLARFRVRRPGRAPLVRERPARARRRALPRASRRRDRPRRLRRAAVRLLPRGRARPAGARALDDARRAAAARAAARRSSSATPGRCCASSCPGQAEGFYAHARRRPPRRRRARALAEAAGHRRLAGHPGARRTRSALAGVDPERIARAARARRAAARGDAWRAAGARRCGRPPALAQQAGMGTADYAAFVERRAVPRPADPVAAWRELRAFQAEPGRAAARRARRSASRPRAPTCASTSTGRTWVNSDGRRNMPSRRGLHRPARGLRRGQRSASRSRRAAAASWSRASSSSSAPARSSPPAPSAATTYLQRALETDAGARRLGELGIGTNFGIDRADRHDPVRREDRRHGAPRARPLLSRDRRQATSRPCTGTSSATCAAAGG